MADAPAKSSGGALQRLVLWLVIAALVVVVWWLASERNQRHFHVVAQGNELVIERGRFFPTGTAASTEPMYKPIAIPAGEKAPGEREFEDQTEMDRFLFDILAGWAKGQQKKGDTQAASALVDRAAQLPGLTGAQMGQLHSLQASLNYATARDELQQALKLIGSARARLQSVKDAGGEHSVEAAQNLQKLQQVIDQLSK